MFSDFKALKEKNQTVDIRVMLFRKNRDLGQNIAGYARSPQSLYVARKCPHPSSVFDNMNSD